MPTSPSSISPPDSPDPPPPHNHRREHTHPHHHPPPSLPSSSSPVSTASNSAATPDFPPSAAAPAKPHARVASLLSNALSPLSAAPSHPPPAPAASPLPSASHHAELERAYVLGGKLGRGCFATVYKATRRSDGLPVAIKVVDKGRLDAETATLLENELDILRVVSQHPGIVTLIGHLETAAHMYFVMNYVEGGQLLDRIVSRGSFSENDARILMRAILLTLQFLSQLGCVHRDIKPENILVDNYSRAWPVKLTDFGLSAKLQPNELLRDALGTPLFIAPEVLKAEGYGCACDMWSLGVVLYIVLCGYPPFPYNEDPASLVRAIVNGRYHFPENEWTHVSDSAKNLVCAMLEVDPAKRITPADALKHPWIAVAQSTSDLPNRNLKSFNARRKLKASVVAVRTTFGFMRFVNSATRLRNKRPSPAEREKCNEDLVRDVERSRELIRSMGISEDGKMMYEDFGVSSTVNARRSGNSGGGRPRPPRGSSDGDENGDNGEDADEDEQEEDEIDEDGRSTNDKQQHQQHQTNSRHRFRRSLILPTNELGNVLSELSDADDSQGLAGGAGAGAESYWLDPGRSFDLEAIAPNAMQSRAKAMVAEVGEEDGVADEENPFLICTPSRAEDVSKRKPLERLDFGILGL